MELTIAEIKQRNMQHLIDAYCNGVRRSFAKKIKIEPTSVSRWFKPNSNRKPSDDSSRLIEKTFNCPTGWLDVPHPELWGGDVGVKSAHDNFILNGESAVKIEQHNNAVGSMGKGVVLSDQPGQITSVLVTPEWIEKNLPHNTGKNNIKIVTGFGDSMKPMFNPGDPILVDAGVKDCNHDGVYFFRIGDEGFIKRLQRIPGQGIRAISANPSYEAWTITGDMDFEVFGKVLKVWAGTDF